MIVFSGVVSEMARLDRMKRINRIAGLVLAIAGVLWAVGISLCVAFNVYSVLYYCLIPILFVIIVVTVALFFPDIKLRPAYSDYLLSSITITIGNGTVSHSYFKTEKPVESVKKVIDVGEFYYLIFKHGDIGNSWVCQKDLLTEGTPDDFEKLFEGKIVRCRLICTYA